MELSETPEPYSWTGDGLALACERALAAGKEVVHADDYTLLLDFDSDVARKRFDGALRKIIDGLFGITDEQEWNSSTPGHSHMLLRLREAVPLLGRIALQAACGSDPMREILNVKGVVEGVEDPCILFKPAGARLITQPDIVHDGVDLPF